MFITLKAANNNGHRNMEQLVARGASQCADAVRVRPRRPACNACQRRKLCCTGPKTECSRCLARSIPCVFPQTKRNTGSGQRQARVREGGSDIFPVEREGPGRLESSRASDASLKPHDAQVMVSAPQDVGTSTGGPDVSFLDHLATEPWSLDHVSGDETLGSHGIMDGSRTDHGFQLGDLSFLDLPKLPQNLPFAAQNIPALLALDGYDQANGLVPDSQSLEFPFGIPGVGSLPVTKNTVPAFENRTGHNGTSQGCTCMDGALGVIQQLDDDDFHIRSLTLDQVVQLQKWILAQCSKPLDCSNCETLPRVHTILVIICDRLAEMFECIHKRIRKANELLSGQNNSGFDTMETPTSDGSGSALTSSSGCEADCNPGLFSLDFKNMYSDEEQVHMIQVLLKLQLRNFHNFLVRLNGLFQIMGSEARREKMKSLTMRLNNAAADIDKALRQIVQFFVAN